MRQIALVWGNYVKGGLFFATRALDHGRPTSGPSGAAEQPPFPPHAIFHGSHTASRRGREHGEIISTGKQHAVMEVHRSPRPPQLTRGSPALVFASNNPVFCTFPKTSRLNFRCFFFLVYHCLSVSVMT